MIHDKLEMIQPLQIWECLELFNVCSYSIMFWCHFDKGDDSCKIVVTLLILFL